MLQPLRENLHPGLKVAIIEKHNQRSGEITEGIISKILTSSKSHPHGIKVMLQDGCVGRVQKIITDK